MRKLFAGIYVLAVISTLVALTGELVTRIGREATRRRLSTEAESSQNQPFFLRGVYESFAPGLWAEPWVRYKPYARAEFEIYGVPYRVQMNGLGFRTREFTVRKPPGTLRIVCIGGSTTVQGRVDEETYPALLEQELKKKFPTLRIEVLNLGVSGAQSSYWVTRSDELFSYEPDNIIDLQGVNDIMWVHLQRYAHDHALKARLLRSVFYQRVFPLSGASLESYFSDTFENIARVAKRAKDAGAEFITAVTPAPSPDTISNDTEQYLNLSLEMWRGELAELFYYREYYDALTTFRAAHRRFVAKEGISSAELSSLDRRIEDFLDICHLRPEGIRALSSAFLDVVAARVAAHTGGEKGAQVFKGGSRDALHAQQ